MKKLLSFFLILVVMTSPESLQAQKRNSSRGSQSTQQAQTNVADANKAVTYDELMEQSGMLLMVSEKELGNIQILSSEGISLFSETFMYAGKSEEFYKIQYYEKNYYGLNEKEYDATISKSDLKKIHQAIQEIKEKTNAPIEDGSKLTLLYTTSDGKLSIYCEHQKTTSWHLFLDRHLVNLYKDIDSFDNLILKVI